MKLLVVGAGTTILLGAPANPVPEPVFRSLRDLVLSLPEVLEAHLPECFVPGKMEAPAQILVLAVKPGSRNDVMEALASALPTILEPGMDLDVWPLSPGHSLLSEARVAGVTVKSATRPGHWWQFWNRGGG